MAKYNVLISYVHRSSDSQDHLFRFLKSIVRFPPSESTTLVITLKHQNQEIEATIRGFFRKEQPKFKFKILYFPDIGYDIGTHYVVSKKFNPKIIVFMSASSYFVTKDWYNLIVDPFREFEVGIVGAMYSKESLLTSYTQLLEVKIRHILHLKLTAEERIVAIVRNIHPNDFEWTLGRIDRYFSRTLSTVLIKSLFWREPMSFLKRFPPYPNPHLRTTGFAIRANLLQDVIESFPQSKGEVMSLESGKSSITIRVLTLGYRAFVATKNFGVIDFRDPRATTTFRSRKGGSIVRDSHSDYFRKLSRHQQEAFELLSR